MADDYDWDLEASDFDEYDNDYDFGSSDYGGSDYGSNYSGGGGSEYDIDYNAYEGAYTSSGVLEQPDVVAGWDEYNAASTGSSATDLSTGIVHSSGLGSSGSSGADTDQLEDIDMPIAPDMPEYEAPEWDEGEIRTMAAKKSGPQVAKLRQSVQAAMARTYDNPNVQRMTLRDALSGYGEGLGSILSAAESAAIQEYNYQYSQEAQAAMTNYQTELNTVMQQWTNDMTNYMTRLQG